MPTRRDRIPVDSGRAERNDYYNDSVYVQFDAVAPLSSGARNPYRQPRDEQRWHRGLVGGGSVYGIVRDGLPRSPLRARVSKRSDPDRARMGS